MPSDRRPTMCLIPGSDSAFFTSGWRDLLWARFFTAAPQRLRVRCVWTEPFGRQCDGDIRSRSEAPLHVDVRSYDYFGAGPAARTVHRLRLETNVVAG